MIAAWKNRHTLFERYDMTLQYRKRYAAQLETFAKNVLILTVADRDTGDMCRMLYRSKQSLLKDWTIIEGDL